MSEAYKAIVPGHKDISELMFEHCPRAGEPVTIDGLGYNERFKVQEVHHHAVEPGRNTTPYVTVVLEPFVWK